MYNYLKTLRGGIKLVNERRFCGMFLLESSDTLVTGVGFRWRIVGDMTGWLGSSVVECSHGQRKALGSSPGRATIFHLLHID